MKTNNTLIKLLTVLIVLVSSAKVFAQPCMETWHYRVPITLDNLANPNPLYDYQMKFIIDTESLIQNSDLKLDAGDLRFTNFAGDNLPFWIQNGTLNTATTVVWVSVDNIPPNSTIDIFMFYGNDFGNSVESGDATFLHYDNFDGSALDFGKWTFCGGPNGGTIPDVNGGQLSLASSSSLYGHSIKSLQTFTDPIVTEMYVNGASNGVAYLGQVTSSENGYGMALEDQAAIISMRLVAADAPLSAINCQDFVNQTPTNNITVSNFQGLWSFAWSEANEQLFSWPSGNEIRTDFAETAFFNEAKNITIGSYVNTGAVNVDYVYTRKYSSFVPAHTFGAFTELVDIVDATANGPVCVGDTLKLFSPFFQGANYLWFGPNGYTSTVQNPIVNTSQFLNDGKYVVKVSAPTGCSIVIDSVTVHIDSTAIGGLLLTDVDLCENLNQGFLKVVTNTGNFTHWESSLTEFGPWNTITLTNDSLEYLNLVQTTYYRAFVESGSCGIDTTNTVTLTVSPETIGGIITGGNIDDCYKENSGVLKLVNYQGDIQYWESSIDEGQNWVNIPVISDQLPYLNLTDTIIYRALIKSGVCFTQFSDTAYINILPRPFVDFVSDSICKGSLTTLSSVSTIVAGFIENYVWNFGDGSNSIDTNVTHLYNEFGYYNVTLTGTSNEGCVYDTTKAIRVYSVPKLDFDFEGLCVFVPTLFNNLSSINEGTMVYDWKFGDDSTSTISSPSHVYKLKNLYPVQLVATTDKQCTDSIIKIVQIYPQPVLDAGVETHLSYGFKTELKAIAPDANELIWTPTETIDEPNSLITLARPLENTTYTISIVSKYGCENSDLVNIIVDEDYKVIPTNVITPNNDGINDTWVITNAESFDVIYINVYDKWGYEVYNETSYKEEWIGTVNFDNLPVGTYYYYIRFDGITKKYSGTINLLK